MKQFYLLFLILVLVFHKTIAQKPFICTPSTSASVPLPANTFTTTKISMINQTSGSLTLKWLKYTNTIPSTWSASLCDYNTCYTNVPNMGTMSPISGLTEGFIKLEVNPFHYTGSATVVIYVYSGSAPTLGDTLIFNFMASGVTSIENETSIQHEKITLLPNSIHIANANQNNEVWISDLHGKVLLHQTIIPYSNEIFLTNNFPTGLYIVRTKHQSYKYFKP